MAKEKKLVDVTDKVLESSIVTGKLRSFEWMMKSNKEPYIWEGRGNDKGATKATKASKKRNRDAKKTDRRY